MKDWLVAILLSSIAVLAPLKPVLLAVGMLIFADLVLGIWAAKKRGENISSAGMRRTISKILVYNICIISGFLMEKYIIEEWFPITKIVAGAISTVELKSILENSNAVLGMNVFKELIKKIGSKNDPKNLE
jgi:hypothetical protein